jgi:hypothetical protein
MPPEYRTYGELNSAPLGAANQYSDSDFWRAYFGLPQVEKGLPELDGEGRCSHPRCPGKGGRIPGFQKEFSFWEGKRQVVVRGAIHVYCPVCHCEEYYDLPPLPQASKVEPPSILSQSTASGLPVEVINLKATGPAILSAPGLVYIGRQMEGWKGHNLHASPLANPYKVGLHGDRNAVCEKFLADDLNPALSNCFGPVWETVLALAKRVLAGERLKLACWCSPERCHGYDLAAAITSVANQLKSQS